jgi:serine/threonine protein kinase
MGACTEPGKLLIVTERCASDLDTLMYGRTYVNWRMGERGRGWQLFTTTRYYGISFFERMKMARNVGKEMRWLHEVTKIIHEDLKPANLLVYYPSLPSPSLPLSTTNSIAHLCISKIDFNNQIKISDFGFSQIKKDSPIKTNSSKGSRIPPLPHFFQSLLSSNSH